MKNGSTDFFAGYLRYCNLDQSECPAIYHRWGCASLIGAFLGRSVWVPFGHGVIYPNQYILLMGPPASKKGTAISLAKRVIRAAGYTRISADRTSKEAFLKNMKQHELDSPESVAELEALVLDAPSESYICAGEFVDFIGQGDTGFMMTLTNLWDNLDEYIHPKITGKSVEVYKPTVNLFGGATPTNFALAFPPEALGSGFLSRVILVHSDGTGVKIPWPAQGDPLQLAMLVDQMTEIKKLKGEMNFEPAAYNLIGDIYKGCVPVDDGRFVHYMDRRHIHLIKLACVLAASDLRMSVCVHDVIRANTMLAATELRMPKALGEFGASRYSGAANAILDFLRSKRLPQNSNDIWKAVHKDITKMSELMDILLNLQKAEKIQVINIKGKVGYLPVNKPSVNWDHKFIDNTWLTPSEQLL